MTDKPFFVHDHGICESTRVGGGTRIGAFAHVRGEHAHRQCLHFLVAAQISLADPSIGIYLPPKVWGIQYKFQPDTVLLRMVSHPGDAGDYIRDYSDFLAMVKPVDR